MNVKAPIPVEFTPLHFRVIGGNEGYNLSLMIDADCTIHLDNYEEQFSMNCYTILPSRFSFIRQVLTENNFLFWEDSYEAPENTSDPIMYTLSYLGRNITVEADSNPPAAFSQISSFLMELSINLQRISRKISSIFFYML